MGYRFPVVSENISGVATVGAFKNIPTPIGKTKDYIVTKSAQSNSYEVRIVPGDDFDSFCCRGSFVFR